MILVPRTSQASRRCRHSSCIGPETPKLYGALGQTTPIYAGLACSPCVAATNHRKTPCNDNICLKVIDPEWVYDLVKPLLQSICVHSG